MSFALRFETQFLQVSSSIFFVCLPRKNPRQIFVFFYTIVQICTKQAVLTIRFAIPWKSFCSCIQESKTNMMMVQMFVLLILLFLKNILTGSCLWICFMFLLFTIETKSFYFWNTHVLSLFPSSFYGKIKSRALVAVKRKKKLVKVKPQHWCFLIIWKRNNKIKEIKTGVPLQVLCNWQSQISELLRSVLKILSFRNKFWIILCLLWLQTKKKEKKKVWHGISCSWVNEKWIVQKMNILL